MFWAIDFAENNCATNQKLVWKRKKEALTSDWPCKYLLRNLLQKCRNLNKKYSKLQYFLIEFSEQCIGRVYYSRFLSLVWNINLFYHISNIIIPVTMIPKPCVAKKNLLWYKNCQNFPFQTVKISLFKLSNFPFSNCQKFPFPNCQKLPF